MAKRRRHNRRRRRGSFSFLYKLLAFLLICTAIILALTLFFRIHTIEIIGNQRYTAEEIIAAADIHDGDNLYLLNKYSAAERIYSALPYVESVQFRRSLPDGLTITVVECSDPVSVVQGGTAYLLCRNGTIVDAVLPSAAKSRTQITGLTLVDPAVGTAAQAEASQSQMLTRLLELLGELASRDMTGDVSQIDLSDAGQITLRYLERFDVYFAWDADYGYKLEYLLAVVEKLEVNETGTINMLEEGKARFIPD